ncbi:unnamed protein product, partial [Prorocentrum cordatum]
DRSKGRSTEGWGSKPWVTGNKKASAMRRSEEYPSEFCEAVATLVINDLA